ncbi:SubName: Full=Related to Vault poly[ADP-ribose] polymerase {ECO:0000313/EMBL:CCA69385.1} [Serendipita indica DSM 11827]|nr:SubName: Full=Related to Vault poly[ADP-ribose] polymerase {ECO:0000313/EMBL:CCA69385.1} [Serendipita indica DSM 11827]
MSSKVICGLIPVLKDALANYPLVKATCTYRVADVYTSAELVQEYYSADSNPVLDIAYVFPLPPSAAVCGFKAIIDGTKVINGVVKEKEQAKQEYQKAVSQGRTAGLLEKAHADVFRVSLGNIKPSQRVAVHISFISIIPSNGESPNDLRLTIPTTIAERYGELPVDIPGYNSENTFALTVDIQMTAPITAISSPTHPLSVSLGGSNGTTPNVATVSFNDSTTLKQDIVVVIAVQNLDRPRCTLERKSEETNAFALTLVPKFDLPSVQSQEYTFLVDRSGSMEGSRIESVKNALQIMLRSLPRKKTTFNIISFGSSHKKLWDNSREYSSESVAEASAAVEGFSADFGGTELQSALRAAYGSKSRSHPDHPPSTAVFVLTDGDSWDLRGVTSTVKAATDQSRKEGHLLRTFVLGVGDSVAVSTCEAMARAGLGVAVFVGSNEKPDAKLVNLLRAARGGVLDNISIDWGREEHFELIDGKSTSEGETSRIMQAPSLDKLSVPMYPGFRCSVFAITPRGSTEPSISHIRLKGDILGQDVALEVLVQITEAHASNALRNDFIHTLAARAIIEELEDKETIADTRDEVVRLGVKYSLATSATSFIAVSEDTTLTTLDSASDGNLQQERVDDTIFIDYESVTMASEVSEEYEMEESDNDMGFGLFDDDEPVASYGPTSYDDQMSLPRMLAPSLSSVPNLGSSMPPPPGAPISPPVFQPTSRSSNVLASPAPASISSPMVQSKGLASTTRGVEHIKVPPAPMPAPLTIATIARSQEFDGSFKSDPVTIQLLLSRKAIPSTPNTLEVLTGPERETVWMTLLVLCVLERFSSEEERASWHLLAEKANEYVSEVLMDLGIQKGEVEKMLGKLKEDASDALR